MSVQERIRKIADDLFNGNISAFCRAVDIKQPTMNTILGERQSKPSYDVLSNIVNAEALNISAQWLLTGKGEMLKSSSSKEESVPITNERLFSIIESQQRTIENLSKK
jgi:bacteriophage CI repressor helix-turn-helix domain